VAWTEASRRGYTLRDLARWMCEGPARLAGLQRRKGALQPGFDADLCVWRPDETFRVDPAQLHHKHKLTPYAGQELHGVVVATVLRGELIYAGGAFRGAPRGEELLR
jgi:allantoinase